LWLKHSKFMVCVLRGVFVVDDHNNNHKLWLLTVKLKEFFFEILHFWVFWVLLRVIYFCLLIWSFNLLFIKNLLMFYLKTQKFLIYFLVKLWNLWLNHIHYMIIFTRGESRGFNPLYSKCKSTPSLWIELYSFIF